LIENSKECKFDAIKGFVSNLKLAFGEDKTAGIQNFLERDILEQGTTTLDKIETGRWE
jgi:hypothetical protein